MNILLCTKYILERVREKNKEEVTQREIQRGLKIGARGSED